MNIRSALRAFSQNPANASSVMRAAMRHREWVVPIHHVQKFGRPLGRATVFSQDIYLSAVSLTIFTDVEAARVAAEGGLRLGPCETTVTGSELFRSFEGLHDVHVNLGSPTEDTLVLRGPHFNNASVWADAMALDMTLKSGSPEQAAAAARAYDAYFCLVFAETGAVVTARNYRGLSNAGLIFTTPDALAFARDSLGIQGTKQVMTTGEKLRQTWPHLGIDGVVINVAGPDATRAIGAAAFCG